MKKPLLIAPSTALSTLELQAASDQTVKSFAPPGDRVMTWSRLPSSDATSASVSMQYIRQRTPMYLGVWTLGRHLGGVRQYSMAAAEWAAWSGPSIG